MNANRRLRGVHLVLMLTAASLLQASHAEESETPFKYSDEWSLVSAPPPAGPYQPVNIDPRVPGAGTIPQVPMAIPRQQASQALPAEGGMEAGAIAGAAEQTVPEIVTSTAPDELPAIPPVPGHYRPVMPQTPGELVTETHSGVETATAQHEQVEEPVVTMEEAVPVAPATAEAGVAEPAVEQAAQLAEPSIAAEAEQAPAIPATAGAGTEPPVAETATAMVPEATVPAPDELTLPLAVSEEPQAPGQAEPVPASPLAVQPELLETPAVAAGTAAGQLPQEQEEVPAPSIAGGMQEMPVAGQSAAAAQEQPYFQPPMPGYYERMMPPAAGRVAPESRATGPQGPAEHLQGQAAERAPASGYYGRPMPAAPGYNYPAPGYPYQSGVPGYRNMPGYGYPRGQATQEEQNVPPPPVYDSMQYPRTPIPGYR